MPKRNSVQAKAESSVSRVNGKDKEENKARISGFKPSQPESEDSDASLEQLPKHAGERHSQHAVERHSQHTADSREITVYEEPVETKAASLTSNPSESSEEEDEESASNDYTFVTRNTPASTVPANTLYTVQATHKYTGEDVDELNFEAGEIIYVIEFENPDEQDDGWQMGIKQSDGSKGVFPENFTRRIG
ncbi:myc box-dependent-interacting protein 1-like [Physella acuta]|uniref:myc box-dependent-interacting protein 1-like n=1 Tax=Physella acuta TaxID=109671 RepID=UPI0027DC86A0|nr:myc box-dependent-interacting protein 1-like [Physella acuta]